MRNAIAAAAVAAILTALAASPCAARHKDITPEQVAAFRPGVATYQDVVSSLGRPQTESFDSDGTHTIQYGSMHAHAKAASFVPIVGLFAGGGVATSSAIAFTFGPDGVLKRYTTQTTRVNCGNPIMGMNCSGAAVPVPPPQEAAQPAEAHRASSQPRATAERPPAPASKPTASKEASRSPAATKPAKYCGGLRSETNPDAVTCP